MPSGSYFADGLVMTSTRSIELAGICSRNAFWAAPVNPEGLPSMRICTCEEPRSDTLPSMSTATEGTLTSSSLAVPPAAERSFPTLNTLRSMSISRELASSTTTASSKALTRGLRAMLPASYDVVVRGDSMMGSELYGA